MSHSHTPLRLNVESATSVNEKRGVRGSEPVILVLGLFATDEAYVCVDDNFLASCRDYDVSQKVLGYDSPPHRCPPPHSIKSPLPTKTKQC